MFLQVCTLGPITAFVSGPWDDIEIAFDYAEATTWFMGRDGEDWTAIGAVSPFNDGEPVFEHDGGMVRDVRHTFVTNEPQKVGT